MRGIHRRSLRLELVAGLAIALAMPAWAVTSDVAATTTAMTAQSSQVTQYKETTACSLSTLAVSVSSAAGVPAGTVSIWDNTPEPAVQLANATLDPTGKATISLALADGAHSLSAVYAGDSTFGGSTSAASAVTVSLAVRFDLRSDRLHGHNHECDDSNARSGWNGHSDRDAVAGGCSLDGSAVCDTLLLRPFGHGQLQLYPGECGDSVRDRMRESPATW